jgi:hypothetical protein
VAAWRKIGNVIGVSVWRSVAASAGEEKRRLGGSEKINQWRHRNNGNQRIMSAYGGIGISAINIGGEQWRKSMK